MEVNLHEIFGNRTGDWIGHLIIFNKFDSENFNNIQKALEKGRSDSSVDIQFIINGVEIDHSVFREFMDYLTDRIEYLILQDMEKREREICQGERAVREAADRLLDKYFEDTIRKLQDVKDSRVELWEYIEDLHKKDVASDNQERWKEKDED